jgi:hypothetical protein
MRRVLVLALILSLGNASAALAGETLLASATRIAREAAPGASARESVSGRAPALAQGQPALATSGMSKRKKIVIALLAGVGFAATAYTIDQKVQDVTPSTLGTRKD